MDQEYDMFEEDSENEVEDEDEEEEEEEDDFVDMGMDAEASGTHPKHDEEDFPFQVLTADEIVKHMVDCIKEVNTVVQVSWSLDLYNYSHNSAIGHRM